MPAGEIGSPSWWTAMSEPLTAPAATSRLRRLALEAALLLLPAAALALAVVFGAAWQVVLLLTLLEVLLLSRAVRRSGIPLVGPLFLFDLVRLARRGRTVPLRCAYGLLLLAGLCLAFSGQFGGDNLLTFSSGPSVEPNALARFAERFFEVFLLLQGVAVLVL